MAKNGMDRMFLHCDSWTDSVQRYQSRDGRKMDDEGYKVETYLFYCVADDDDNGCGDNYRCIHRINISQLLIRNFSVVCGSVKPEMYFQCWTHLKLRWSETNEVIVIICK